MNGEFSQIRIVLDRDNFVGLSQKLADLASPLSSEMRWDDYQCRFQSNTYNPSKEHRILLKYKDMTMRICGRGKRRAINESKNDCGLSVSDLISENSASHKLRMLNFTLHDINNQHIFDSVSIPQGANRAEKLVLQQRLPQRKVR